MPEVPKSATAAPRVHFRPFAALREALASGYGVREWKADLTAGAVVAVVALPLSMALAIAAGVPPQHGLYTAIIGGSIVALLGGSRVQVSGPTASFVVILAPIAAQHGLGGLLIATLLAGVILMLMGLARLGRLIEFIPYPVTIGFTAGIGVVIATLQVKDFFGLQFERLPDSYAERVFTLIGALPEARWQDFSVGMATLALLWLWPKLTRKIPAPLIALVGATLAAELAARTIPGFDFVSVADRFSYLKDGVLQHGLPRSAFQFGLPWNALNAHGEHFEVSWALFVSLLGSAFAIAVLAAIASLLSAVVADGLAGTEHDPDAELFALGCGNVAASLCGAIPVTGAIARTTTSIRHGAKSPIASITHSAILLVAVLALAPLLGRLPMAALSALLLVVAWNMIEVKHLVHTLRTSPRADSLVLGTCLLLTVVFDMTIAVSVGVVLASLLFMRRMAELSEVRLVREHHEFGRELPEGVLYYEVAGPLFFGAAHRATAALSEARASARAVLIDLRSVPAIDATGVVNLKSAIARLHKSDVAVVLAGMREGVARILTDAGVHDEERRLALVADLDAALARAAEFARR